MTIRLVVTGAMEKLALGPSLERVFEGAEAEFVRPLQMNGMTGNPLPDASRADVRTPTVVQKFAKALVNETLIPSGTGLPDLVVGLDDLELANVHQPQVVTAWVRRALLERVDELYSSMDARQRARDALRARCSFHLLAPLTEAYFFGERQALTRAGVAPTINVRRVGANVEGFATDDPTFLDGAATKNEEMCRRGYPWWREERHPKRYLEFLVEQSGGLYDETVQGVSALQALDWPTVGSDAETVPFARALFEDLSDALETANPLGHGVTAPWTYPERGMRREDRVLRNL